ncbi:restriction endonuclease [Phaeobacter gallaeciensis]|nr:restriction endonuclease [Phaeobacter gallaeciensis]
MCSEAKRSRTLISSRQFEQRVARIYQLLEAKAKSVTWDKHIPDPDAPTQQRQIDIEIRRPDALVHVECRHRRQPQDVMWVEELIGRRVSLGADLMIAVSSSGYTNTAKIKAEKHGILLRELEQVSEQEVLTWGVRCELLFRFARFSKLRFNVGLMVETRPLISETEILNQLAQNGTIENALRYIANTRHDEIAQKGECEFYVSLAAPPPIFTSTGESYAIGLFDITGLIQQIDIPHSPTGYCEFRGALERPNNPNADLTIFDQVGGEIISHEDKFHWHIDLNSIRAEPNSFFSGSITAKLNQPMVLQSLSLHGTISGEGKLTDVVVSIGTAQIAV